MKTQKEESYFSMTKLRAILRFPVVLVLVCYWAIILSWRDMRDEQHKESEG